MNARWAKKVVSLIAMLVALSFSLQIVSAGDEICDWLLSLHDKFGSQLESYLSDAGKNCLLSGAPLLPANESFVQSFSAARQVQVELFFSPGIYQFNLDRPIYNSDRAGNMRYITLSHVVEEPENCIRTDDYSAIYFPTRIRIEADCEVSATLGEMGAASDQKYKVSISRIRPRLTARKAERWSQYGFGSDYNSVEIVFSRGLYSLSLHQPDAGDWGMIGLDHVISDPPGCFGSTWKNFPSQVHINQDCRIYAILNSYLKDNHLMHWHVAIHKIE